MGLRELAKQDNKVILNDRDYGFGYPITVTNPAGVSAPDLIGFSNDISQVIDPDTGMIVSGRQATVALHRSDLTDAGLSDPVGIVNSALNPWTVVFTDVDLESYTFKVVRTPPDRSLGMIVCVLEIYEA